MSNPAKIKRNIIKVVKIVIKQKIIGISLNYSNPYFYFNEYVITLSHLFLCPIYFDSSISHFPFCFTSFNIISVPPW